VPGALWTRPRFQTSLRQGFATFELVGNINKKNPEEAVGERPCPVGKINYVNEVACRLRGYAREEIQERSISDLNDLGSATEYQSKIDELNNHGRVVSEAVTSHANGTRFPDDAGDGH
jgi:PAS domain-containing protein